jgi:hypothetical protein
MPALRPVVSSPPPPNRTCDFHRIRLSMSTTRDCSPVRLASDFEYSLRSGNDAPIFTGDLLPSDRAACSLDPFALWTALPPSPVGRDSHAATGPPPRPGGNGGRCACPETEGSAGTAGALPTFTHTPVGRVGIQLYPGGIAARHRNAARGLEARDRRAGETVLNEYQDRAPRQPIAASFGAGDEYRGFNHWYRFPYAFLPCYRTRPAGGGPLLDCRGPLAARRRTFDVGAALQLLPAVAAAGGEVSHPTRTYGASWRRLAFVD